MGKKAKRAKDKYYHLAKEQGYRARSAFKLVQLDKKYNFLSSANCVIDLCAAPGGWLQVASKYCPVTCTIVGVDLVPIRPIPRVITHAEDITGTKCRQLLTKDLNGQKADVVLNDGAPNVGANWERDAYTQSELVLCALKLAVEFLRPGGLFITKVFRSSDYHSLLWVFNQLFKKVDATKPHSSRNTSAEIFVACHGFLAPHKIDPKLLSAQYVFKELESDGPKTVDVLHKRAGDQRRHRDGYDEKLGVLLTRVVPAIQFINSDEPVRVLSDVNTLTFADEASKELLSYPATTPEILSCCEDLKLLGRNDFKGLLKWRMSIVRSRQFAEKQAEKAAAAAEAVPEAPKSEEEQAAEREAALNEEMQLAIGKELSRKKRERKREFKAKQKQLKRKALGMEAQAVDIIESDELFSLKGIKDMSELDTVFEVDLETASGREVGFGDDEGDEVASDDSDGKDDSDADDDYGLDDKLKYQQFIEDQMDYGYTEYIKKRSQREKDKAANPTTSGIKLSRKERLAHEAAEVESKALQQLDYEHQKYLRLLSEQKHGSDDSDDDSESDGSESEAEAIASALAERRARDSGGALLKSERDLAPESYAELHNRPALATRAARWFSQPMFDDVLADEQAELLGRKVGAKTARGRAQEADSDDDDDDDDHDSDGGAGIRKGKGVEDSDSEDFAVDSDGDINPLAAVPKSERQKRKDKLRKQREKEQLKEERKKKKEHSNFEVVPSAGGVADAAVGNLAATEAQQQREALIKAGMGKALDDEAAGFLGPYAPGQKPTPAVKRNRARTASASDDDSGSGSGSDSDGEPAQKSAAVADDVDPRLLNYDSDTHAEMLALGLQMRRHTTAKALIDASYNRYCFNDEGLPKWFEDDEHHHFKPQLPVDKDVVDRIKAQFRDIAARPIRKVAEARARKKMRMMKKLEQVKATATSIVDSTEMSDKSKARALERAYKKGMREEKKSKTLVVHKHGRKVGTVGKGARVEHVDPRMKKEKRKARQLVKAGGSKARNTAAAGGKKRYKKRH